MTPTEAVDHLIKKGWGKTAAAGLVAVVYESGKVTIRRDRWSRFWDWARAHDGKDPHSDEVRLDWISDVELLHGFATLGARLEAAETIEEAVKLAARYR